MSGLSTPTKTPGLCSPGHLSPRRTGTDVSVRRCEELCSAVLNAVQADVLNVQQKVTDDEHFGSKATVLSILHVVSLLAVYRRCVSLNNSACAGGPDAQ